MADQFDYLGAGIVLPFRRDGKDDFAHSSGVDMVNSSLTTILGTLRAGPTNDGEVPFNQKLGTALSLLRHRNVAEPKTRELATHYVVDSIQANEPRVHAKAVGFRLRPDDNRIALRLRYDVVTRDTRNINVISSDIEQEFVT